MTYLCRSERPLLCPLLKLVLKPSILLGFQLQQDQVLNSYDELKIVVEGGNVTLTPEVSMKEEYTVNWRQEKSTGQRLIAQWKNFKTTIVAYQDVLQLDLKNGSLTFIGIRREHSGLYSFQILEGKEEHSGRYYNITVYGKFPVRQGSPKWVLEARHPASSPSDKSCYVACSVKNGPDVNLTWFNGPTIISSVNNSMHISMTLSLPLEIQPENKESFTCEARNPVTVERKTLSSTKWCPSHHPGTLSMPLVPGLS
uniref:Ig-like domain-containing protein n=1 Tax=Poecilia latipinna TaxID=48699 RepID=A0A3B3V6G8_9TELE